MYSSLSPLYQRHATEVVVEFANLDLNFDVNTIMHLRPFIEVLLTRKVPACPTMPLPPAVSPCPTPISSSPVHSPHVNSKMDWNDTSTSMPTMATSLGVDLGPGLGPADSSPELTINIPKGMHITITMNKISMDLLRTSTSDSDGAILANAFSLQITDLRTYIDIIDFVKADVKLRSFDIIDTRAVSTDYVFKKVFCPIVDMNESLADWKAHAVTRRTDKKIDEELIMKNKDMTALGSEEEKEGEIKKKSEIGKEYLQKNENKMKPPDLLHITYAQLSSNISAIEVIVLNVTSFVAIDTILDFFYVAMENFFAILDLIAAPSPSPIISVPTQTHTTQTHSTHTHPKQGVSNTNTKMSQFNYHHGGDEESIREEEMSESANEDENHNNSKLPDRIETARKMIWKSGTKEKLDIPTSGNPILTPSDILLMSDDHIITSFQNNTENENENVSRRSSISPAGKSFAFERNSPPVKLQNNRTHNDKEHQQHQSVGKSSTMTVTVKVTNPRLILLEDPTSDESKALVGSCDIEVHYSREFILYPGFNAVTKLQNKELRESLHVSVHNHEVFVLRNMSLWHPLSVVEPMGVEFNLRRCTKNGKLVSSIMSVDLDDVNARVSVNDIFLLQSIFTRRSITEPSPVVPGQPPHHTTTTAATATTTSLSISAPNVTPEGEQTDSSPSWTLSLNMGSVSLVGINDFNGQNVPVVRTLLDGTTFFIEVSQQKMHGEGSLIASACFYNPRLSVWEPMMDRWHPQLSLTSWALGSSVELKSDHTMQLTVSGIMLEKLLETYSLFFRLDDMKEREEVPDVVIVNALGSDISFDIYDSATNTRMISLLENESRPLPRLAVNRKNGNNMKQSPGYSYSTKHTPTVVDIHFQGDFGNQRLPLHHLPLNINRPRAYNLQPRLVGSKKEKGDSRSKDITLSTSASIPASSSSPSSSVRGTCSSVISTYTSSVVLEPIVEEVYESARYDPIAGRYSTLYCPILYNTILFYSIVFYPNLTYPILSYHMASYRIFVNFIPSFRIDPLFQVPPVLILIVIVGTTT